MRIITPPTSCKIVSVSSRITTASKTATKGSTVASSAAFPAPIRRTPVQNSIIAKNVPRVMTEIADSQPTASVATAAPRTATYAPSAIVGPSRLNGGEPTALTP